MPSPAAKHNLFWLVVHGSFGPGGNDHHRLSELAGTWQAGSFAAIAGPQSSDLIVKRYHDQAVPGWALRVADKPDKPDKPGSAAQVDGSMQAQLFEIWAAIDQIFGDDVARMDTTFAFETSQPGEGDVCRANTYGSPSMIPDGRYDAPHPTAELGELWHEVIAGEKNYEPSTFASLITELAPDQYDAMFASLPDGAGFLERLHRLAQDRVSASATNDAVLLDLAASTVQTKSRSVSQNIGDDWEQNERLLSDLSFERASGDDQPELGDLHYDLSEGFADAASFSSNDSWTGCLAEACYGVAGSHDLAYWLTQDWRQTKVDLEPLYAFWRVGGSVAIDTDGVAHVSITEPR